MSTTMVVGLPWGRYHANRWDRNVNEAAVDWPPSPWRILRALYAVWRWHHPDLPADDVHRLLEALAVLPRYQLPQYTVAHTRHYYPGLQHRQGLTGETDKTFDAFVVTARNATLLIDWPVELGSADRELLARLAASLSYLGRADSIVEARLLSEDEDLPRTGWLEAGEYGGPDSARCLAPTDAALDLDALCLLPQQVRRKKLLCPPGTRWVSYPLPPPLPRRAVVTSRFVRPTRPVTAVRFVVASRVKPPLTLGVAVADLLHKAVCRRVSGGELLVGRAADGTPLGGPHRHAHWLPFAPRGRHRLEGVLLWVPGGLDPGVVGAMAEAPFSLFGPDHLGLPSGLRLVVETVGDPAVVCEELSGVSVTWRSATPYAPSRHERKVSTVEALRRDIRREAGYRGLPEVVSVEPLPGRWLSFRRHRASEPLTRARRAQGALIQFAEPVHGPLALGQLSHFGLGIFTPD